MNFNSDKSVTLIELLVAVSILGLLVIGLSNIDTFSHFQVISSDRRAKLQHDAAYVLEHMSKNVARGIGNEKINGAETVIQIKDNDDDGSGNSSLLIKVYIDAGDGTDPDGGGPQPPNPPNGKREAYNQNPEVYDDHWIAYRFYPATGNQALRYQIRYCGRCRKDNCKFNGNQCMDGVETLGYRMEDISSQSTSSTTPILNNYIQVQLTACWDPDNNPIACGAIDNPAIMMQNRINMPSVSVN